MHHGQLITSRKAPISDGFHWCSGSLAWLAKSPSKWLIFSFCYGLLAAPLCCLPGFNFIFPILLPTFLAVLYQACETEPKLFLNLKHLFDSYKKEMFLLGALNIGMSAVVLICSLLLTLVSYIALNIIIGFEVNADLFYYLLLFAVFSLALITGYFIALSMLVFSPVLVIVHAIEPWDAMMLSLKGVMKNMGSLTLYSIILLLPIAIGYVPLVIYAIQIEVPVFNAPQEVLPWLRSLYRDAGIWIRLIFAMSFSAPFIGISLYLAYKSIFVNNADD